MSDARIDRERGHALVDGLRAIQRGELADDTRRRILSAAAWELIALSDTVTALNAENAQLQGEVTTLRARLEAKPH